MLDKILDFARIGIYVLLGVTSLMIYEAWVKDHPAKPAVEQTATQVVQAPAADRFVPEANKNVSAPTNVATSQPLTPADIKPVVPDKKEGTIVTVKTDVLELSIDVVGGDIVESKLLDYPESLGSKTPFSLLTDTANNKYFAESGLLSLEGPDTAAEQAIYVADKTAYALEPGQNELVVKLKWQKNNISAVKTYTLTRGSYDVKVGYELKNNSSRPWSGNLYTQLVRTDTPPAGNGGIVNLTTYFGAAISSEQKPFEKITFKEMQKANLNQSIKGGWAAMIQHYFISAWVPKQSATSNYYTRVLPNGKYAVGMIGTTLSAQPGETVSTSSKLYTGPAIADKMETVAPNLKLTIDYGWFWFISVVIFWMMQKIYEVIGNWGWSIVLVTVLIKVIFYRLSAKSYRSMSALKKLQPKIEALKKQFGDDKQKLTQATMELYRKEKVNPMSGCLPILIQIPVFIGLYWVLVESVQLRQAPFILWIHDLSQHDPYYILPVMMGISMFIQQRLNPPPPDPMQAKVMMLMPIVFTVLFANFPAGLMLYWFVNNTLSFLQQWYVMKSMDKEAKLVKA